MEPTVLKWFSKRLQDSYWKLLIVFVLLYLNNLKTYQESLL